MRRSPLWKALAVAALLPAACSDRRSNPVSLDDAGTPSLDRNREDGQHDGRFLRLESVAGPGEGRISAMRIPHPTTSGNFALRVRIRIRHARPNTDYIGQRAAESSIPTGAPASFDPATLTDGSCQRGLAIAPWPTLVPPLAPWSTFPDQAHGLPALIITTDRHGNAAADFDVVFAFPLPLFDVMFRVIENSAAPMSVLQSECTLIPLL